MINKLAIIGIITAFLVVLFFIYLDFKKWKKKIKKQLNGKPILLKHYDIEINRRRKARLDVGMSKKQIENEVDNTILIMSVLFLIAIIFLGTIFFYKIYRS